MATTFNHFSRINIVLPEAQGVAVTHEGKQIEVAVQKDGTYLVNGLALESGTEAELINMLQKEAGNDRKQLFVIAADAQASHQAVVRVMDVAGKMGFLNLNITTVVPVPQHGAK